MVICRHAQSGENFESPNAHVPTEVEQGNALSGFLFQLILLIRVLLMVCSVPGFLSFCVFSWWFHCFKTAPKSSSLVFWSSRRQWRALRERKYIYWISFIQACIIVLLALSSMLMNQQYKLNEVSLNRNTNSTRLCTDQLMKTCDQQLQGPNPVAAPPGAVV